MPLRAPRCGRPSPTVCSWPMGRWGRCSRRRSRRSRTSRVSRAATRSSRHSAGHRPRRPRGVSRRRGRCGRDEHLRGQPRQPRRVRHRPSHPRARGRRGPDRPGGRGRLVHARAPAVRPRLDRAGHQAALARPRPFAVLRDVYQECAAGLVDGGADALLVETCQDLLQAKAAVIGAKRAVRDHGGDIPVFVQVTVETTGTMLLAADRRRPHRSGTTRCRRDRAPTARPAPTRWVSTCVTSRGTPGSPHLYAERRPAHAHLRRRAPSADPGELAAAQTRFVEEFPGCSVVGGCRGTTPSTSPR